MGEKVQTRENKKFTAVDFANAVTIPSACRSDWIARRGPYSLFQVLERMLPKVIILLITFDGKVLIL